MSIAPPAHSPRTQLGHFRLLEKIGAGGMGEVYRARDEHLQRDVAIKLLPAGSLDDSVARARFRKEALALSRLNHPHIATIHDFDTEGGVDFLVMEFVPGLGLRDKLARGPLAEPEVVRLGAELAEAMAAAHQHGVIHRDLKPENLRITDDGRLKVLDFGVSKLTFAIGGSASAAAQPTAATVEMNIPPEDGMAGTLPYMAPEQLKNEKIDERTDIWAAGVLLYEMATGHRPFVSSSGGLAAAILREFPISPRQFRPELSPALETVILKCLEKEPARRYQSARELLAALETLTSGPRLGLKAIMPPRRLRGVWMAVMAICALAGVVSAAYYLRSKSNEGAAAAPLIRSLAVLPLANLSGQSDQDYLADGMTEALITDLARIGALKVISRTSCMRYKNSGKAVPEIARELGVDAVIEGSVLRVGDRVRVTAQLLHGASDRHLWAASYDRDFKDVLALQSELAERIVQQIQLRLGSEEQGRLRQRREVSPAAYDLWLRGNYLGIKTDEVSYRKRIDLYRRAVEIDPKFAPAHATLSFAYISMTTWNYAPPPQACGDAEREARQALALDDQLASAHTALSDVLFYCRWNFPEAEREIKTAIQLSPNYSFAHYEYAFFLALMRRFDEAIVEAKFARTLDPASPRARNGLGYVYYYARRYDEAIPELQSVLEIEPSFRMARVVLSMTYALQGKSAEAFGQRMAVLGNDTDPQYMANLRAAFARGGLPAVARVRVQHTLELSHKKYIPPTTIAGLYLEAGEPDACLDWLEKAYTERDVQVLDVNGDPRFDAIRLNPRFQQLTRRLGFSASAEAAGQAGSAGN
jgi:serine/threonine protein kinase/tetratricopeptide (TPR) repeat protein